MTDDYLDRLLADGRRLAELHRELLPLDEVTSAPRGSRARIEPYRSSVARGGTVALDVTVRNPFDRDETARVRLARSRGWSATPPRAGGRARRARRGVAPLPVAVGDAVRRARSRPT